MCVRERQSETDRERERGRGAQLKESGKGRRVQKRAWRVTRSRIRVKSKSRKKKRFQGVAWEEKVISRAITTPGAKRRMPNGEFFYGPETSGTMYQLRFACFVLARLSFGLMPGESK